MRRWVISVAVALLAGCGGAEESGRIVFEQQHLESGRMYIEGFEQFVELRGRGDRETVTARFDGRRLELAVVPGDYTILSYSRPCSAHCDQSLDAPRSFCERRVNVGRRQTRHYTVRTKVAARCSIRAR